MQSLVCCLAIELASVAGVVSLSIFLEQLLLHVVGIDLPQTRC